MTLNEVYLPKSSKDAKLVIFIGPPKTGTTSINVSIRRQLLCNRPNGMVFWPLNSPLPNPSGKIISCARESYDFVNGSQLNDVARLLCRDALSLKLIPVKLSGISFLTSEYFWSHLDSLQKIITHCRPHFKSIEIVFIKRDLRSLAISGTVQNLKILIPRSSVDYLHAERQAITKRKIVSLLSSNQDISISGLRKIKFEKFQNFCKENASIPINFLDYNKTSDIVSSFFANVFGVKVDKDSFLRKNRSSSFGFPIASAFLKCIEEYRRAKCLTENEAFYLDKLEGFLSAGDAKSAIEYIYDAPERKRTLLEYSDLFETTLLSTPNVKRLN